MRWCYRSCSRRSEKRSPNVRPGRAFRLWQWTQFALNGSLLNAIEESRSRGKGRGVVDSRWLVPANTSRCRDRSARGCRGRKRTGISHRRIGWRTTRWTRCCPNATKIIRSTRRARRRLVHDLFGSSVFLIRCPGKWIVSRNHRLPQSRAFELASDDSGVASSLADIIER